MAERRLISVIGTVAALAAACLAAGLWFYILSGGSANRSREVDTAVAVTAGGDPDAGRQVIISYGCAACHEIPGVSSAKGRIGPSLDDFREQQMIAGVLSNSADNLTRWIEHPRAVDPRTAMPDLGLTHQQARDAAAYLYAPK